MFRVRKWPFSMSFFQKQIWGRGEADKYVWGEIGINIRVTVLLDAVAFLNKLTKILCSMLTMTMTWHKVNWLKILFRLTSNLSKSSMSRFSYLIATENENNRQKILLAGTNWTWLCPWLGIIIVGRWDSIFVNLNSKVPNWHLPNSANPLLYL